MECLGDMGHVESGSVCLEMVLVLVQLVLEHDRCTVCVERTIGSEIMLDAPDGILGDVGHVESRFFSVWGQC